MLLHNATDRYPSRTTNEVTHVQRHDPVVHGTADDGPLDQAQLDEFDARGVLQIGELFDADEVAMLRAEFERLADDRDLQDDPRVALDPDAGTVRSIFQPEALSEKIDAILRDPRMVDVARQLLGSDVSLYQSRLWERPRFRQDGYWHSDFETWHVEDGMPAPRAVAVSIALTDDTESSGSLMLMPGSHWTYVTCVRDAEGIPAGIPDEKSLAILSARHDVETVTGSAGDVLFFDANVMHGSSPNTTTEPRSNLYAVYNSVDNALDEPYGADEPRPTFVANREATPIPR